MRRSSTFQSRASPSEFFDTIFDYASKGVVTRTREAVDKGEQQLARGLTLTLLTKLLNRFDRARDVRASTKPRLSADKVCGRELEWVAG